jgi:hypothetical protein
METEMGHKKPSRHLASAGLLPFRLHDLRQFMATEMRADTDRVTTPRSPEDLHTLDFYADVTPTGDRFADVPQSVLCSRPGG